MSHRYFKTLSECPFCEFQMYYQLDDVKHSLVDRTHLRDFFKILFPRQ